VVGRVNHRRSTDSAGPGAPVAWDPDPDFRTEEHVRHAAVLLEGLAGGRWAPATKTHHALVDGVGSVNAGHLILDAARRTGGDPRAAETDGQEDRLEEVLPLVPLAADHAVGIA
jgi:Wax ester synthase-like Acyl-CoA acyltransferase domain